MASLVCQVPAEAGARMLNMILCGLAFFFFNNLRKDYFCFLQNIILLLQWWILTVWNIILPGGYSVYSNTCNTQFIIFLNFYHDKIHIKLNRLTIFKFHFFEISLWLMLTGLTGDGAGSLG